MLGFAIPFLINRASPTLAITTRVPGSILPSFARSSHCWEETVARSIRSPLRTRSVMAPIAVNVAVTLSPVEAVNSGKILSMLGRNAPAQKNVISAASADGLTIRNAPNTRARVDIERGWRIGSITSSQWGSTARSASSMLQPYHNTVPARGNRLRPLAASAHGSFWHIASGDDAASIWQQLEVKRTSRSI